MEAPESAPQLSPEKMRRLVERQMRATTKKFRKSTRRSKHPRYSTKPELERRVEVSRRRSKSAKQSRRANR